MAEHKKQLEEAEREISTVTLAHGSSLDPIGSESHDSSLLLEFKSKKAWPTDPNCYKLGSMLGRSENTEIWEASCVIGKKTKRLALKQIDVKNYKSSEFGDLKKQMQTIKLIRHPNIVDFYSAFPVSHYFWVASELMEGAYASGTGSFGNILRSQFPAGFSTGDSTVQNESVIATVLYNALTALYHLHGLGRIHRNIKAGHILLSAVGEIKLTDFSVTTWLSERADKRAHSFVGDPSLCWMAPEMIDRARRKDGYGFAADIWSIGITAIELAEGKPPLHDNTAGMKIIMSTILAKDDPPKLKDFPDRPGAKWSKPFHNFISTCTQQDPSKRPTAGALMKHPFLEKRKGRTFMKKSVFNKLTPLSERLDESGDSESKKPDVSSAPIWVLPEEKSSIDLLAEKIGSVVDGSSTPNDIEERGDTTEDELKRRDDTKKKDETKKKDDSKKKDDAKKKDNGKKKDGAKKKDGKGKKPKHSETTNAKNDARPASENSPPATDLLSPSTTDTAPVGDGMSLLGEVAHPQASVVHEPLEVYSGEDAMGNFVVLLRTIAGSKIRSSLEGRDFVISGTLPPLPVPPDVSLHIPFNDTFTKVLTLPDGFIVETITKEVIGGSCIMIKINRLVQRTNFDLGEIVL